VAFELANLLYHRVEMSETDINLLLELWALKSAKHDDCGPFALATHMYKTINATRAGDAPWQCLKVGYKGQVTTEVPSWHRTEYKVWFCDTNTVTTNMLCNTDFNGQFDYRPYYELNKRSTQRWSNFMSGTLSWDHSIHLSSDEYPTDITV
jgi:hypothetical protein